MCEYVNFVIKLASRFAAVCLVALVYQIKCSHDVDRVYLIRHGFFFFKSLSKKYDTSFHIKRALPLRFY